MSKIFDYRPEGLEFEVDGETKKLMVIRNGKRGIISVINKTGDIVIWDKDVSESHINDTEEQMLERLKELLG